MGLAVANLMMRSVHTYIPTYIHTYLHTYIPTYSLIEDADQIANLAKELACMALDTYSKATVDIPLKVGR